MQFKMFFAVLLALLAHVVSAVESLLCDGWLFSRDRASWAAVSIPHDWAIAGPFSETNDLQFAKIVQDGETVERRHTGRTGALPWPGRGWYRRELHIPKGAEYAELVFDGAMSEPIVYADGVEVGRWMNGYNSFTVQIPVAAKSVEVALNNPPASSRWYPGSGLIRPVRLVTGGKVGISTWGSWIRTTALAADAATVEVATRVRGGRGGRDDDWAMQDDHPWAIGEFGWTGFDYLGEPTPYKTYWPSRSSYFGMFDLAGIPKDRAWLYRSRWRKDSPTLHVLPHWTWPGRECQVTPVYVYTSYPEAELFVNGVSHGRRRHDPSSRLDRYRLRWREVIYEPGEVRVVAFDTAGKVVAEKRVRTVGKACRLDAAADRTELLAMRSDDTPDLAFVTVRVVDADGNLCPDSDIRLDFAASGAVRFKTACNGDATSLEPFVRPTMKAFHGQIVVVVEALHEGAGTLVVSAEGLPPAIVRLNVLARSGN